MKNSKGSLSSFLFLILFAIIVSFTLPKCSGGSVPAAVCDYGAVVCDVSQTLCRSIPGIPPEVCEYIDLACYDLDVLCSEPVGSVQYKAAEQSLNLVTEKLKNYNYALKDSLELINKLQKK